MRWSDNNVVRERSVQINRNRELQAIFEAVEPDDEPGEATLTVDTNLLFADNPTGGGTFVKGATTFVSAAAEVIDTESPEAPVRYVFSSWSDGVKSRERNVVVNSDMHLTAYYLEAEDESEEDSEPVEKFTLKLTTNDPTLGLVSVDYGERSASVEKEFEDGEQAVIAAHPERGARFVKWSDDKTAVQRTKGIHQNLEIQAIFEAEEPDEEPEPESSGSGEGDENP